MSVLVVSPVVLDGVYRISTGSPQLYLEWQSDGNIKANPSSDSGRQEWTITSHGDGTYLIKNVDGNDCLCSKGNIVDSNIVSTGFRQNWTLDRRGDKFIIGVVDNDLCVSMNVGVQLLPRNNTDSQHWTLDAVDLSMGALAPPAGIYHIRNRATNGELVVTTSADDTYAPVSICQYQRHDHRDQPRAWNVYPGLDGLRITNACRTTFGPRSIQVPPASGKYQGPCVGPEANLCRIIPVPNSPYFHIATRLAADHSTDTAQKSQVLRDQNPRDTNDTPIMLAGFNKDDTSQHWEFILAP